MMPLSWLGKTDLMMKASGSFQLCGQYPPHPHLHLFYLCRMRSPGFV